MNVNCVTGGKPTVELSQFVWTVLVRCHHQHSDKCKWHKC